MCVCSYIVLALTGPSAGLFLPLLHIQTLGPLKRCRQPVPSSLVLELGEAGVSLWNWKCWDQEGRRWVFTECKGVGRQGSV